MNSRKWTLVVNFAKLVVVWMAIFKSKVNAGLHAKTMQSKTHRSMGTRNVQSRKKGTIF
jgi:hypothetical protein